MTEDVRVSFGLDPRECDFCDEDPRTRDVRDARGDTLIKTDFGLICGRCMRELGPGSAGAAKEARTQ